MLPAPSGALLGPGCDLNQLRKRFSLGPSSLIKEVCLLCDAVPRGMHLADKHARRQQSTKDFRRRSLVNWSKRMRVVKK